MTKLQNVVLSLLFAAFTAAPNGSAQTVPALTVQEVLSRNINGERAQQDRPIAHKVIGNIYYVGTETLSSWLITTPQGHILINSTFERDVPVVKSSVEKLGFSFKDIKILLTSHGHIDHVEGDAMVKELTGAQVMVMDEDVVVEQKITPGGKAHPIDKVLHHLDEVALGGTTLVAHLTPAHTPGCTTWTMRTDEGGKTYNVVMLGCGLGTGRLVDENGKVTKEVDQYIASFRYLRSLPCDVFLAAHGPQYNLMAKYANVGKTPNPFIDPEGYKTELDNWERFFIAQLSEQLRASLNAKPK